MNLRLKGLTGRAIFRVEICAKYILGILKRFRLDGFEILRKPLEFSLRYFAVYLGDNEFKS